MDHLEVVQYDPVIPLDPSLKLVKPRAPGFIYHEPTDIKPENIPDKLLFPEKWNFYDVDLDIVIFSKIN
jgi:hypothetical protein